MTATAGNRSETVFLHLLAQSETVLARLKVDIVAFVCEALKNRTLIGL